MTDAAVPSLATFERLAIINLSRTSLTDAGFTQLVEALGPERSFQQMIVPRLDVSDTKVTRKTVESLRAAYPRIGIQYRD